MLTNPPKAFALEYHSGGTPMRQVAVTTASLLPQDASAALRADDKPRIEPINPKLAIAAALATGLSDQNQTVFSPALMADVKDAAHPAPLRASTHDMTPLDGSTDDCVPPQLAELLFQPGRATYALLDGALIMGLPERLAASGLRYASLYQGEAEEEFADTAPYIAELTPDAPLTKTLFSVYEKDGIQRGIWADEASIILQSPASLDALKRHFRKFTYVTDEDGKRMFFRFYVPVTLRTLIAHMDPADLAKFGQGVDMFLCPAKPAGAFVLSRV